MLQTSTHCFCLFVCFFKYCSDSALMKLLLSKALKASKYAVDISAFIHYFIHFNLNICPAGRYHVGDGVFPRFPSPAGMQAMQTRAHVGSDPGPLVHINVRIKTSRASDGGRRSERIQME